MFHIAIWKRCGAGKSRIKVAGFVSTLVMFAANRKAPCHGECALFQMIEFSTSLRSRGTTVPGMAKWALRVYDGSLNPPLPLGHPSVVALTTRGRSDVPKHAKHAPMLELELLWGLGRPAVDGDRPPGVRFYASAYLLLVFASLGFPDLKSVFGIWRPSTAIRGRSIDRELKSTPIITGETPSRGFTPDGEWPNPLFTIWGNTLQGKEGAARYFGSVVNLE